MLQAPLTVTTAKLDISLLLKSSPSPPSTSYQQQREPPQALLPRSSSVPPQAQPLARGPASHRTSVSSTVSTATSHAALSTATSQPSQASQTPFLQEGSVQRPRISSVASASALPLPHSSSRHTSRYTQQPQSPHAQSILPSPHHLPMKRPPPSTPHPAASPAKRQSKWTPEEDALIIDLRGSQMKWEDISKRLPGRSAISCRLHYQNYLERRSEWDDERKNRLARLYER